MMHGSRLRQAFEAEIVVVPLDRIRLSKAMDAGTLKSIRYKRILASVAEVGLVEPLVVSREKLGLFRLLDGHARYAALSASEIPEARCLVALDDEAFTYNKRISHLATIQEHFMIIKALARGASEERLAAALNLDVDAIRLRRTMLEGICPEVVDLLKAQSVSIGVFSALRRMKPMRQIEAVELMTAAGNMSASYARVLLAGTRAGDLVSKERKKKASGLSAEQLDRMQREMEAVQADFRNVETSVGPNLLQLVVATTYIGSLLKSAPILEYLRERYPEFLSQFQAIVKAMSLDGEAAA